MSSFFSSQARGDDDRKNRFVHSPPVGPDGASSTSSHGNGHPNGSGNGNGLGGIGATGASDSAAGGVPSLRERAASQPPRGGDNHQSTFFSSPSTQHFVPSSVGTGSPWSSHRIPFNPSTNTNSSSNNSSSNNNNGGGGGPQPVPIRSSSYSTQFSSAIRERRRFPSTFEDDESSELDLVTDPISSTPSDRYGMDDIYGTTVPPSLSRGRTTYGHDPSRSRAQSLATFPPRPALPIGGSSPSISPSFLRTPTMQSWNESLLSSIGSPPSTTSASASRYEQGRYGEMIAGNNARNATSRYASLGTNQVSSSRIHDSFSFFCSSPSPPSGGAGGNGHTGNNRYTVAGSHNNTTTSSSSFPNRYDVSNVSPFVRDVGEILLDTNPTSGLGSLWAGMQRDEGVGGAGAGTGIGGGLRSGTTSGTTSRRHSVSVVQPRTRGGNNIVGFNAPGSVDSDEPAVNSRTSHLFHHHHHGGSSYTSSVLGGGSSASSASYFGSVGSNSGVSSGGGRGGGGGMLLTDEELADDLGLLSINPNDPPPSSTSSIKFPPSQPSSLPIFGTSHSRSPVSARDTTSPYRGLGMGTSTTNGGGNSYLTATAASLRQQRQQLSSPSDEYHPGHPGISESPQLFESQQPQQLYSTEGVKPASPFINTHVSGYGGSGDRGATSPLSPTSGGTSTTTSRLMVNPQQPPYYSQPRRGSETHGITSPTSASTGPNSAVSPTMHPQQTSALNLNELGKGIPLHSVPSSCPLYIVQFKAGRTDLYYVSDHKMDVRVGDLVIVEADRGRDLGKVINEGITVREIEAWQRQQAERAQAQANAMGGMGMGIGPDGQPTSPGGPNPPGSGKKEINPKMIYAKAGPHETQLLAAKTLDEQKALQLCQTKVRAKKLPMEVVDAEYQWDRRKLTFYFVAEKRIDFRELVRELFRLYKTRIWMASLQGLGGYEQ
ncbi:hypothetical protein M378DRAFT_13281 [Amanita muscaria Koide BX008]|uniref:PSP1 C-terminal domain-containing protein n=1 Tax=Amanita muscaria (strain Koide BX008) TaxID=946122 RepID=A0A0C2WZH2_AMAMK|nr:hypothetical protein M378DRAFT_13281 [Amanita muscaria Koide BX008]